MWLQNVCQHHDQHSQGFVAISSQLGSCWGPSMVCMYIQVLASVLAGVCVYVLVPVSWLHCIPTLPTLFCDAWQFQGVNPTAGSKEQSNDGRK